MMNASLMQWGSKNDHPLFFWTKITIFCFFFRVWVHRVFSGRNRIGFVWADWEETLCSLGNFQPFFVR